MHSVVPGATTLCPAQPAADATCPPCLPPAQALLCANSAPTINDITAAELVPLVQRAGQQDSIIGAAVQEGRLLVQASGSKDPVIDLSQVSHYSLQMCSSIGGATCIGACIHGRSLHNGCW